MEVVQHLLAPPSPSGRRSPRQEDKGGDKIGHFLAGVAHLGDATPSDADLAIAKSFLLTLNQQTARDHLRATDEMLMQVPTEFQTAMKTLQEAESFVFLAASGRAPEVQRALERDWDLVNAVDRDGHTALHAAAATGSASVCRLLLSKGANPSTLDFEGCTPLHWAVENNSPEVVDVLLASGADLSIRNGTGQTANDMVGALKQKHQEPMFALLRAAAAKQAAAKEQNTLAATIGASSPGGPRRT